MQAFQLIQNLSKNNSVTLITSNSKNKKKYELYKQIEIMRVNTPKRLVKLRRLSFCIKSYILSLKDSFDIVLGNDWHGAFPAVLHSKIKNEYSITYFHGMGALISYKKLFAKILLKISDEVLANSHEQIKYLRRL